IATPIARLPLTISTAVSTALLPAATEAVSTNDKNLLKTYINQSYRYVTLLVLPLSVGTMFFAAPILNIIGPAYVNATSALQILAVGMLFFTLYTVSSSIAQGFGKPYLPMVVLVLGTFLDLGLSLYLVPIYGINGTAIATTISGFFIMAILSWKILKIADVSLSRDNFIRIVAATSILGLFFWILPKTLPFLMVALILATPVYAVSIIAVGGMKKSDVRAIYTLSNKMGPLSSTAKKIADFMDRFAK
ncbi:MAG TPA: polysaccharide biosynthesis C-terminal domain-containing protein, partial [Methanobacteriaceae archaeon]|nr:polysaccharide biosynthesis C-terminal domain-containing protein [Methanobacteriaceae archaeon]